MLTLRECLSMIGMIITDLCEYPKEYIIGMALRTLQCSTNTYASKPVIPRSSISIPVRAYYFREIDSMAVIYFLGFDIAERSRKKNEIFIRNPLRSSPFPVAAAASSSSSWSWLCQQTLLVRLHILLLLLLAKMASCRSLRSLLCH